MASGHRLRGGARDGGRRPGRRGRAARARRRLQILWSVRDGDDEDDRAAYRASWEIPLTAPLGLYRIAVTANRYRLRSAPFAVRTALDLRPRLVDRERGRAVVALDYPAAQLNVDFTYRPRSARGGRLAYVVGGRRSVLRSRRRTGFVIEGRPGANVEIAPGAGRDRYGNRSGSGLNFSL